MSHAFGRLGYGLSRWGGQVGRRNALVMQAAAYKSRSRLVPVGKMLPMTENRHPVGRQFIHRLFGYRGILVDSWMSEQETQYADRPPDVCDVPFYMALCAVNDPMADNPMPLVAHEDIIPYVSSQPEPINNQYFEYLLEEVEQQEDGCWFGPSECHEILTEDNRRRLPYPRVYRQTTHGVCITVVPLYEPPGLNQTPIYPGHRWTYSVTMHNTSKIPLRLSTRHWLVEAPGREPQVITGSGVVGKHPELWPGKKTAFDYTSYVVLKSPLGRMGGHYMFERLDNGFILKVTVPTFILTSHAHEQAGLGSN